MNISTIIPTYKKTSMLTNNLEHNLPFLNDTEIIIINDDPEQSIKDVLKKWPQITLIENNRNIGFAGTVNRAASSAHCKYLMFLNSDVKLSDSSYKNAITRFEEDQNLFAVSFAQREKHGETVGKNRMYWQNGFFHHSKARDITEGINGWAEGGASIFDAAKFNSLQGFDEMYNPFYWEDIDLSYRAWKSGYTVLFDPSIVVEHHHESTIGSFFSKNKIKSIAYRNQLLFIWNNISDIDLKREHYNKLTNHFFKAIITDLPFVTGYLQALGKMKSKKNHTFTYTDHEILAKFSQ